MDADYKVNWHHELLCEYLDRFISGDIKKLMVFMPPQHGKSRLVSESLPAYILGQNPKAKIIGVSYNIDLNMQFNAKIQRMIDSSKYSELFPETKLNTQNFSTDASRGVLRNAKKFEIVKYYGYYKSAGAGNGITGNPCDFGIIDDPVKDSLEATSPTYQARMWDWYNESFLTRIHNDSKILLTMTRWDKNDLAGKILAKENDWEILLLEGIKERQTHPKDPREIGEALWESRHSKENILKKKANSERTFKALYQQQPQRTSKGLVYPNWVLTSEFDYNSLKEKTQVFYGLDFGFSSDPLALIECFCIGKDIFLKEILYDTQITNTIFIDRAKDLIDKYSLIYADHAPDRIAEIQKYFPAITKAKKGANSIIDGVNFIHDYNLHICENSNNLINEISLYAYKEGSDGEPLPSILQGKDHSMDGMRYAIVTHLNNKLEPATYTRLQPKKRNNGYGNN